MNLCDQTIDFEQRLQRLGSVFRLFCSERVHVVLELCSKDVDTRYAR